MTDVSLQVAFIEELQRRLTPANGKPLRLPGSKSSPNFAHVENNEDGAHPHEAMEDLRAEPRSPFELRALEVALDVVRFLCSICACHAIELMFRECTLNLQQRAGLRPEMRYPISLSIAKLSAPSTLLSDACSASHKITLRPAIALRRCQASWSGWRWSWRLLRTLHWMS